MQYALEVAKKQIQGLVQTALGSTEEVEIKSAPSNIQADLAVPMFRFAKSVNKTPTIFTQDLAEKIDISGTIFSKVKVQGGFLNFDFDWVKFSELVFADFKNLGEKYGSAEIGKGKTIVIDYSAPNIAKPFSVGHLRSTIIGQAIYNLYKFLGYNVIGDNHIGDWGTQFGKLMCAFSRWGDKKIIDADPIKELLKLYVQFEKETKGEEDKKPDPKISRELMDNAYSWFRKLEAGDAKAKELWKWFAEISLKEFERIYKLLGVSFDKTLGESFYNDKLIAVIKETFDKGLAKWDEMPSQEVEAAEEIPGQSKDVVAKEKLKAAIIPLDAYGIKTPLLIQTSDGRSLYATRDLATAKYRIATWNPEVIVYVVGGEQQLYFLQWFKALELMDYKTPCVHVWFGLVRLPEGKMSTRKGRVIFLEEVLNEAIEKVREKLIDRNFSKEDEEIIAKIVGVGAVKYADLSQNRTRDIVFDWEKMLNMQGDSGPYLQYQYVRIQSILKKAGKIDFSKIDFGLLQQKEEFTLIATLAEFPEVIKAAAKEYYPHILANSLFDLSQKYSSFYKTCTVIQENKELEATRLWLCQSTAQVLKTGLFLLGIECPEKM